jgi:hypothetical protein
MAVSDRAEAGGGGGQVCVGGLCVAGGGGSDGKGGGFGFGSICDAQGNCISGSGQGGNGQGSGQICGPGGCISGGGGNGGGGGSACDRNGNCISGFGGAMGGGGATAGGRGGSIPEQCVDLRTGQPASPVLVAVEEYALVKSYYQEILKRRGSVDEILSHVDGCRTTILLSYGFVYSREHLTRFVSDEYRRLLDREPDQGGLNAWVGGLERGMTTVDLEKGFITSPEFQQKHAGRRALVAAYYEKVLGRTGSEGEISGWANSNLSTEQIALGFLTSQEARDKYVRAVYKEYLHREAEPQGVSFWSGKLGNAAFTKLNLIQSVTASQEYTNRATAAALGQDERAKAEGTMTAAKSRQRGGASGSGKGRR